MLLMGMSIDELFGEEIGEMRHKNDVRKRERQLPSDDEIMAMVKRALVSLGEK